MWYKCVNVYIGIILNLLPFFIFLFLQIIMDDTSILIGLVLRSNSHCLYVTTHCGAVHVTMELLIL